MSKGKIGLPLVLYKRITLCRIKAISISFYNCLPLDEPRPTIDSCLSSYISGLNQQIVNSPLEIRIEECYTFDSYSSLGTSTKQLRLTYIFLIFAIEDRYTLKKSIKSKKYSFVEFFVLLVAQTSRFSLTSASRSFKNSKEPLV